MAYDGTIKFNTKIDTSGVENLESALAGLKTSVASMGTVFASFGKEGQESFSKLSSEFKKIDNVASVTGDSLGAVREKKKLLQKQIQQLISKGIKPEDARLKALQNTFKSLTSVEEAYTDKSKKTITAAEKLTKILGAVGLTASIGLVISKVKEMGAYSLQAASDVEETGNKFNVTFSGVIDSANEAATALSDGFGLSSQKAQQLLSDTGDLLTGFGFTQESALNLSNEVNKLAVDLASFTNYAGGAEGASAALTSGLLGEREAMKSLGIAITEADIKQLAEEKGIVGELDRQTKAMLTLELAMTQSKNAIGDFARSSDSYANVSRTAEAATQDLAAAMGQSLLPAATDIKRIYAEIAINMAKVIEQANELKVARAAEAEGNASLEQQLAILIARRERYTGATRAQKEAMDNEIAILERQIARRNAYIKTIEEEEATRRAAAEAAGVAEEEALKRSQERQKAADAAYKSIADGFKIIADKEETAKITGEEYDATLERRKLIIKEINTLNEAGFSAESGAIQYITSLYGDYLGQYKEGQDLVQEGRDAATEWLEEYQERQEEAAEAEIRAQERTIDAYHHKLEAVQQAAEGVGEVIGEVIQGEMTLGEAAKEILLDLVASALQALGKQWGIEALAAYARSLVNPAYLQKAVGLTAASAAAYVGAGIVKSFDVGAWDVPEDTLAVVHKKEMVLPVPFAEDYRRATSSSGSQTTNIVNNTSGSGGSFALSIELDGKTIAQNTVNYVDNGRIRFKALSR